jgi:tetratricopeptide (TPR) repeat protein
MQNKKSAWSDKLKWNKSTLLETDIYIKVYLEALNKLLSTEDKQALFLISKYYTDGAAETGRNHFSMAVFNFSQGEALHKKAAAGNDIFNRVLLNVYHRSKSFYLYKQKDYDTAIRLINETLSNNILLEQDGFQFLLFDRVQQCYNLARVYFAKKDPEKALMLLAESTGFLIQLKSEKLKELNRHNLTELTPDLCKIRQSLLCQFVCDTAEQLLKISGKEEFILYSGQFFNPVTAAAANFKILMEDDRFIEEWLRLLTLFYNCQYTAFTEKVPEFLKKSPGFFSGRPAAITKKIAAFAKAE